MSQATAKKAATSAARKYFPSADKLSDVYKSGSNYAVDYRDRAANYGEDVLGYIKDTYPVIVGKAKSLAHTTAEQSRTALEIAGKQLGTAAHTVGDQVRYTERRLLKVSFLFLVYKWFSKDEPIQKATASVKAHINENPVQSTVIALGAGYLLSKILR